MKIMNQNELQNKLEQLGKQWPKEKNKDQQIS